MPAGKRVAPARGGTQPGPMNRGTVRARDVTRFTRPAEARYGERTAAQRDRPGLALVRGLRLLWGGGGEGCDAIDLIGAEPGPVVVAGAVLDHDDGG